MPTTPPAPCEFPPFYAAYIARVPHDVDIRDYLERQTNSLMSALRDTPTGWEHVLHAPYTWTPSQVLGHLIDGERIFGYRALRFARGDTTPLPGFDENSYARAAASDRVPWPDLLAEFEHLRDAHALMFRGFPPEAWSRGGEANGAFVSVRALAYCLTGHVAHHLAILCKRLEV